MSEININLTLKQIYDAVCPACQEKIIEIAAQEGSKSFAAKEIKDSLEKQLKEK